MGEAAPPGQVLFFQPARELLVATIRNRGAIEKSSMGSQLFILQPNNVDVAVPPGQLETGEIDTETSSLSGKHGQNMV